MAERTDALGRETPGGDPLDVLARWLQDVAAAGLPSTMTLATADGDGAPHARTVVVTAVAAGGVRFHSSSPTTKTDDLAANPRASGVLHWPALGRQVVLTGATRLLGPEVSRAAFPGRPRQLRLLAWVYEDLAVAARTPADGELPPGAVEEAFAASASDPTRTGPPPGWRTVELAPERAELWQAGTDDVPPTRTRFLREDGTWRSFPVLP